MESKAQTVVLIKEKNQLEYVLPTNNPNTEFSPDGQGELIQIYNFKTKEFVASYKPSEDDWARGLVILKMDDHDSEVTTIIELKLVEYLFPANIFIKNGKYLKFKKYNSFLDKKIDLTFNFSLFYKDTNEEEYVLYERNDNKFSISPSVSVLLSDSIIEEIEMAKESGAKVLVKITSNSKDFLDCILEVELEDLEDDGN